jgi:hypothetical protein
MKTLLFSLITAFAMLFNVAQAQEKKQVDYLNHLPEGLEVDNSTQRKYTMTTDYFEYDLKGNFLRKTRVAGEYTCEIGGDSARWNNVYSSQSDDLDSPFPKGMKQDYMENFKYKPDEKVLTEDFFIQIPEANMFIKNLIWDVMGFDILAYTCWDSLELNKEYHSVEMNSKVDLAGEGTFENKDIILTWIGITKKNNEVCAIIKYSVMNNPLELVTGNFIMSGRSHYWGEVYVSLSDRQIEYASLLEDVVTDVTISGQTNNILGYTVRKINLSKIN